MKERAVIAVDWDDEGYKFKLIVNGEERMESVGIAHRCVFFVIHTANQQYIFGKQNLL